MAYYPKPEPFKMRASLLALRIFAMILDMRPFVFFGLFPPAYSLQISQSLHSRNGR
jgi:hypothetical protein